MYGCSGNHLLELNQLHASHPFCLYKMLLEIYFFSKDYQFISLSPDITEGVPESLKPKIWYQLVTSRKFRCKNFIFNSTKILIIFKSAFNILLLNIQKYFIRKQLSEYNPKTIIMRKHEWMHCDQVGPFPFEPKILETITIKTVSTRLSEFHKIPHTTQHK